MRKKSQEAPKTTGDIILIIQKLRIGSLEYHKLKSTNEYIKNMLKGTKIIAINTIKRVIMIPFTSRAIFSDAFTYF
jgi:hypothetical protein